MYAWIQRHRGAIIFGLSILAITLFVAVLWKHKLLSPSWLKNNKDSLDALNSLVTLSVFIIASVFSYYKYFRGRTLSLRAEPQIDISIHETPEEVNLHAYTITVKNVGTSTIWNPKPHLKVKIHGPKDISKTRTISVWSEEEGGKKGKIEAIIEADETTSFFGHQHIPKGAWAVTYNASVTSDSHDTWFVSKTVSNIPDVKQ